MWSIASITFNFFSQGIKPQDLLPNTEIYKQFIPGRPFFCRGEYDHGVKDEYSINGLELVTLTDNDRNIDVTIFLNLESGKNWISNIVNGKSKSHRKEMENNSSGKLEFDRSGANIFVSLIFVTIIFIEI